MKALSPRIALLMTLPPLMWAGNAVVGRLMVGQVPPMALNALRWALAGRNRAKLEAVAARLAASTPAAPAPALLVADAADAAALAEVAASTRVVVTTVGPYTLHGAIVSGIGGEVA